jgi:hypothetical protein
MLQIFTQNLLVWFTPFSGSEELFSVYGLHFLALQQGWMDYILVKSDGW